MKLILVYNYWNVWNEIKSRQVTGIRASMNTMPNIQYWDIMGKCNLSWDYLSMYQYIYEIAIYSLIYLWVVDIAYLTIDQLG